MKDTIPHMLMSIAEKNPLSVAQYQKDATGAFIPTQYPVLVEEARICASALIGLGVENGGRVGLISENRKEWLIADLGTLFAGSCDVPRGCDTMPDDLAYILNFSSVKVAFMENAAQAEKLTKSKTPCSKLSVIVLFDSDKLPADLPSSIKVLEFKDFMEEGKRNLASRNAEIDKRVGMLTPDSLASIIFTSGTTGEPKGVMISHMNFLHQVYNVPQLIHLGPSDIWLCVLPVWHSFERIMQYVAIGAANALAYSKPIGKIMLEDMAKIRPTWMASVPRIWEALKSAVYKNINKEGGIKALLFKFFVGVGKIHAKLWQIFAGLVPQFKFRIRPLDVLLTFIPLLLITPIRALGAVLVFKKIKIKFGGRFVAGISGGGALPPDVDSFFAAIGVLLLEGYGLTESSPVLGVRDQRHPVYGTVGPVFPGTVIEIRTEEGKVLPYGKKGIVFAKGPQIMKGYLDKPELTEKVISVDGWLNTGDLGMLTRHNELKIVGRFKDTIVLRGGENIEPLPIEQKICESTYIAQAMLVGQDQKYLAALIVPDVEAISEFAKNNNITVVDPMLLIDEPMIVELINQEINTLVSGKNGFRPFELVCKFTLLKKSFEVGVELSQKQEMKRFVINDMYADKIKAMFKE